MTTTLELLEMPHNQALPVIIQEALKPGFDVTDFVVAPATLLANGDVRHMVTATPEKSSELGWPYQGAAGFKYHRLPLQDFFDGIVLRLKVETQYESGMIDCYTHDIIVILQDIFGIVFSQNDYVNEHITGTPPVPYLLKASANSARWTGKVNVYLYPDYVGAG